MSKVVKPLVEQSEIESRRNWHKVTAALRNSDFEDGQKQKYIIEERERALRKTRHEQGVHWKPALFHKEGDSSWRFNDYKPDF